MPNFPPNPSPGDDYTESNTTWIYSGPVNGWYRDTVNAGNTSTYGQDAVVTGLSIPEHDYIEFDPVATPATGTQDVIYKTGGSSGYVVATLTLTYSSGNLVSVAKS
jgi:hypothetical protein